MNSDQSFFQVVWSSEKLGIPLPFVLQMGGSVARRCILRDVDENVWPVEVAARGDEWFFRSGWPEIHRQKSLENGDILVLHYRGCDLFDFTHYKCEKRDLGAWESSVGQLDDEEQVGDETKNKTQKVPDYYGAGIFDSGLASRPGNPYFVSRSRTLARKNELFIPKHVIQDYDLSIPKKLLLADEQGRKWMAKIKLWKDGRLWCIRGWGNLCRANHIEWDDTCICEFVQEEDSKDMCMRVRVVSADN